MKHDLIFRNHDSIHETPESQGSFVETPHSARYVVQILLRSYLLFVEPRLIGNLDVVSVRVANVCREVVGTHRGRTLGVLFEIAPASIAAL